MINRDNYTKWDRHKEIFEIINSDNPVSNQQLHEGSDYNEGKTNHSVDVLRDLGLVERERLPNAENGHVYGLRDTVPANPSWDDVFDSPLEFINMHGSGLEQKIIEFLQTHKYASTRDFSDGHANSSIRKVFRRLHDQGILNQYVFMNGYLKAYSLEKINKSEIDVNKDYNPVSRSMGIDTVDMFRIIKKNDRTYWNASHFEEYGFQRSHSGYHFGVLKKQGLIKQWGGKGSPYYLTDKGKDTEPGELLHV